MDQLFGFILNLVVLLDRVAQIVQRYQEQREGHTSDGDNARAQPRARPRHMKGGARHKKVS